MLTEITNEAIALAGGEPITIVSNLYFQVVLSVVLSVIAALITDKIVEPVSYTHLTLPTSDLV